MKYPRYPVYRESGVQWLGEIPAHWEVKRLKYLADCFGGGTPDKSKDQYWTGNIPWVSPKDMSVSAIHDSEDHISEEGLRESATRLIPTNSVLVVVRSGILRHTIPVAINKVPVSLNQDLKALVSKEILQSRYLAYFIVGLNKALLDSWSMMGCTVESIETESMLNSKVPMAPTIEQRAIANFLDRETAKIDALVAKKRELIERLKEKRAALITHAVTKGLDARAPMKESGVPWLGKIPVHWHQTKLRYVATMRGGLTPSTSNEEYWGGVMPWVTPKDMKVPLIADAEDHITEIALAETRLEVFEPGKVLIVVRGMILAHTFPVAMNTAAITVNQDMKALDCGSRIIPAFLYWLLRGLDTLILNLVEDSAHGTKVLRTDQLQGMRLYLPPRKEQEKVVNVLEASVEKYKFLIHEVEIAIATLNEHRSALISAAVTGKIDVREAMRKAA